MNPTTAVERAQEAAAALRTHFIHVPNQAVILGSGLSPVVDLFQVRLRLSYSAIPHFPDITVPGHRGELVLAGEEQPVLFLLGRYHHYEGRNLEEIVLPVRALALAGVQALLLTNAAGGLRPALRPGDLCLIADHLYLLPESPLRGAEALAFGARHLAGGQLYDPGMGAALAKAARAEKLKLPRATYAAVPGPQYETPAEAAMLRRLGADLVGMSTAPEVLAARQMKCAVAALSLVTNTAGRCSNHEEVLAAGQAGAKKLGRLLKRYFATLSLRQGPTR